MKKWLIILLVFLVVLILLLGGIYVVFFKKNVNKGGGGVIENPMKQIIIKNTDASGKVNAEAVVSEGVKEFNVQYINYILIALGVGNLHKSLIGYGNPVVELDLDNQIWSSEIKDGGLYTGLGANDNKDLKITMSKQEAVKALLSQDMKQFMKDSVANGNTKIEMIAGKPELGSKGYLEMYNNLK
ncbi:MAG: hypothetical protein AABX54_03015 [Nanoarchaeota archaeon]